MTAQSDKSFIRETYHRLYKALGPQHWWPGDTPFEVIVGAILTQNTNWTNVEKAIRNLKQAKVLAPAALRDIPVEKLAQLIRPAGYFNVKAKRLKNFMKFFFERYGGKIAFMKKTDGEILRQELLAVNGIGPETADSILLYALEKTTFVVDAYTKRILYRHNLVGKNADYHALQDIFNGALAKNVRLFNEYHALIVRLGKDFCRTKPNCGDCPLKKMNYSLTRRCPQCYRALSSLEYKAAAKEKMCGHCRDS